MIEVAGLKISTYGKQALLGLLSSRIAAGEQSTIVTPYSEFLYRALIDPQVLALFNRADFALADGVGILWAQYFLSLPLPQRSKFIRSLKAAWQLLWTLCAILLHPRVLYRVIPEKIAGAEFVWDLAELAAEKGYTVYLLGGFGHTTERAANALRSRYPNIAIIAARNWSPGEEGRIIPDIEHLRPDMLLVAFGPLKQEEWIMRYVPQLPVKLAIGLGGTFDYIAGDKHGPPAIVRAAGLEWLFRLVTQPKRFRRIMNATFGFVYQVWKYKVNLKG